MSNPTHLIDPSVRILTDTDTDRNDWLRLRRAGLGGSDAYAATGLDRYKAPLSVWLNKTGRAQEEPDNPHMAWGRMVEPVLRTWFEETTGIKVHQCGMLGHPTREWQLFTPDGLTEDDAIIEIKTVGPHAANQWDNGPADRAAIQLHHGMAVTGKRKGYAIAGIWGREPIFYEVHYNPELEANLIQLEAELWQHILDDVPPALTGHPKENEVLHLLHPVATDDAVELTPVGYAALRQYVAHGKAIETLKAERDAAQSLVLRELASAGEGIWNGRTVVTSKNTGSLTYEALSALDTELAAQYDVPRHSLNTKALYADHPEVAAYRPRRFSAHL
jgi:putative phage-type endonuclease